MPTPLLMPSPRQRFVDNSGLPLANGMVFTFAAGTSDELPAYTDAAGLVPHENPIRLDLRGEATIYWLGNYKVDVRNQFGQQLAGYPVDNFNAIDTSAETSTSIAGVLALFAANSGSTLVSYILSAAGAVKRTVQDKLSDIISTKDFGATGGPLEDGTAFDVAATAKGVALKVPVRGATMFKVGGIGTKLWRESYGIKDPACVLSVSNVADGDEPTTQIVGLAQNSDVWQYGDRDHVAFIAYTRMRAATVTTAATTFTETSVTSPAFASAIASGKIKFNMMIDTVETPKKTGFIQSVNSATNTINVDAWYVSGVADTTGVPAANTVVKVNPMTKAWALNANIEIPPDSDSTAAAGFELGVVNSKADGVGYGYDVVSLGSFRAGTGMQVRGNWVEGLHIFEGTKFGIIVNNSTDIGVYTTGSTIAFQSDGAAGVAYRAKNSANAFEVQNVSGSMLTLLDGAGRWTRFKGRYSVVADGATIDDFTYIAVCTGTTATLPAPGGLNPERILFVKNVNAASCTAAGPIFGGAGGLIIATGKCLQLVSDGSTWMPISQY